MPPNDLVAWVFDPETKKKLRASANTCRHCNFRLEVATASGPLPSDLGEQIRVAQLIKVKRAWDAYFSAAQIVGLFNDKHGSDLLARLRDDNDGNFRGALAECRVAWFLAGRLKFDLQLRPSGKGASVLEFQIRAGSNEIAVEVKAPFREATSNVFYGTDADALQSVLEIANGQFPKSGMNLLVISPELKIPIYSMRRQLTDAFFGEKVINIPIDLSGGGTAGPPTTGFKPSGRFIKRHGKGLAPRFTTTSAVLTIEEDYNKPILEHRVFIVHNPFCKNQIPKDIWGDIPQFVPRDGEMIWTDGHNPWH